MSAASTIPSFQRATQGRFIAGLCAGVARQHGWDVTLVRLVWIFLTLATGIVPGVLTYLFAWMFVPRSESEDSHPVTGLHRSYGDRKLGGVVGGLAETWKVDPTLLRVLTVFGTLITGLVFGFAAYVAAWIVLPLDRPSASQGSNPALGV